MKKENTCTKIEWRYLFPCNYSVESIQKALMDKTSFDGETKFDISEEFVDNCDYITLVPIEVALDTETRERVRELSPKTRFIITGVHESDVSRLVKLGYEVVDMDPYAEPEPETKPVVNPKDVLKDHSWAEIKDALEVYGNLKPLLEILDEDGQNILNGLKKGTIKVTVE